MPMVSGQPGKFTIFVESGNIETTGETPSFVYRYQMVMFVMDYAGELDDLTLPLLAVIRKSATVVAQPLSVIRTSNFPPLSMTMTAPILLFTLLRERVRITRSSQGHTAGRTPAGAKTPRLPFRRRLVACIP